VSTVTLPADAFRKPVAASARTAAHITDTLHAKGFGHVNCVGPTLPRVLLVVPDTDRFAAAKAVLGALSSASDVRILAVRVLRPWSDEAFTASVPTSVEVIHVLDETRLPGRGGGLLFDEVFASVLNQALFTKDSNSPIVFPRPLRSSTQLSTSAWASILRQLSGSTVQSGARCADEVAASAT